MNIQLYILINSTICIDTGAKFRMRWLKFIKSALLKNLFKKHLIELNLLSIKFINSTMAQLFTDGAAEREIEKYKEST
eukprot:SAG31_NODE_1372_length_8604_cov_9.561082_4_plen_78_part_00